MARGKYKRKRERKLQRDITVQKLGLSTRVANALEKNGILTLADLTRYSETNLLNFHGIGPSALGEIRSGLQKLNTKNECQRNTISTPLR